MKSQLLLTMVLLIISLSTPAQITTDGTLGSRANLPGPDYQIGADLGRQHGGNLFHSFPDFNLNSLESATFSGPNNVQNILSRVTGGNPSNIDGLIRSTIPNADFYFVNPYGIVFGENAQLDVQGSFHASTADYLRLGENGRFDARNPSDSILTVAPIESFGFLDNSHGKIEVNGRGMLNGSGTPRALLQVPDGKSLSLIGGDIHLSQGMDEEDLDKLFEDRPKNPSPEDRRASIKRNQRYSQLRAPGGTINLASIQQAGELALTQNGLHSTATQSGTIHLEKQAILSTTGENGGNLFIRAGQFIMTDSRVNAHTLGIEERGLIDIQEKTINLQNSGIWASPFDLGNGPDIQLNATESINIKDSSILNYSGGGSWLNYELGNAGHVTLRAKNMALTNITIMPDTYTTGQAGNLTLMAENN
ncbi:MAG: filamentous hemagglutinin N-terminal domain-containing protein, partial [Candidatus Parabeggiatoa sp.]|nr:filamentous hemagglutinin N-terminal domain-containing protein [Candidatus Parabeggiatoa sp.]